MSNIPGQVNKQDLIQSGLFDEFLFFYNETPFLNYQAPKAPPKTPTPPPNEKPPIIMPPNYSPSVPKLPIPVDPNTNRPLTPPDTDKPFVPKQGELPDPFPNPTPWKPLLPSQPNEPPSSGEGGRPDTVPIDPDFFRGWSIDGENVWGKTSSDQLLDYICGSDTRPNMVMGQLMDFYRKCGISAYVDKLRELLKELSDLKTLYFREDWKKNKCYAFYPPFEKDLPRVGGRIQSPPKCCENIINQLKELNDLTKEAENLIEQIYKDAGDLVNLLLKTESDSSISLIDKCKIMKDIQKTTKGKCPKEISQEIKNKINNFIQKVNDLKNRVKNNSEENCREIPMPDHVPPLEPVPNLPPNYASASPSLGIPGRIRPL